MNAAKARASQEFLPIKTVQDGIVILKDGGLRSILMTSSINFELKSSQEQDAVILQFQNFLNSLDFSVQFFMSSRRLNIEPYLDTLRERQKIETGELLKIQTAEYIEFVKNFVETSNIVTKTFYVVVPYSPPIIELKIGTLEKLFGAFGKTTGVETNNKQEEFEEQRTQLYQRVDVVTQGLMRTGVRTVPLNTEELIELFYGLYNPGEAEKGKAPAVTI